MKLSIFLKAFFVAIIVGSLLLVINQWEAVTGENELVIWKMLLTYCVPFTVYLTGTFTAGKVVVVETELDTKSLNEQTEQTEQQGQYLKQIKLHGVTVRDVADKVNSASKQRLEVAEKAILSAQELSTRTNEIDSRSSATIDDVSSIASETSQVLDNFEMLLNHINSAVERSTALSSEVDNFGDAFSSISNVANTIAKISSQTKLLALNAAIEAARAGEAGRGFSVVAEQIKALSDQVEQETNSISSILSGLNTKVDSLTNEMTVFSHSLSQCVSEVTNGEADSIRLRKHFDDLLNQTHENIRKISQTTINLRSSMDELGNGMQILIEGTNAAVEGSSKNKVIGQNIVHSVESLTDLFNQSLFAGSLHKFEGQK